MFMLRRGLVTLSLLHIQPSGGFSIGYEDKPFNANETARLQSLLTYLILIGKIPQSSQHPAFLLWPDASESNAHNILRQFLLQLRRFLPDPDCFLTSDGRSHWRLICEV
jgi:DNA-binding SARP family transcriptional activator